MVLLVDVSRSRLFGTAGQSRKDVLAEIAAVLSFSAIINNDKVGALFFSEKVEKFIPPKKGRIPADNGRNGHIRSLEVSDQCHKEEMYCIPSVGYA